MTVHVTRRNNIPVVVAVLVLVAAGATWLYLQSVEIERKTLLLESRENSLAALQRQLAEARAVNAELQREIQQLGSDLEETEASLDELLVVEEQSDRLQSQFMQYREQAEQQLLAAGAEEDRLQRALQFHRAEVKSLKLKLSDLTARQQQSQESLAELTADYEKALEVNAGLEKRLQEPEQSSEASVIAEKSTAVTGEKTNQYRTVRLHSLRQVLANQDSAARKAILADVIPTIPSGISATELLPLVEGMHSGDILAVIQAVHKYLQRPVDNTAMSLLAGTMNEEDAVTASLMLSDL